MSYFRLTVYFQTFCLAIGSLVALAADAAAQQAAYPVRPIGLVVPYPAGGTIDVIGRVIAAPSQGRSASKSSSITARSGRHTRQHYRRKSSHRWFVMSWVSQRMQAHQGAVVE